MPSYLPTLRKTWQFRASVLIPAQGSALACNREIILTMKNALVSATGYVDASGNACTPTKLCTVVASSNGVVADANDNWQVAADLVWDTNGVNPHSWIVFAQPEMGANAQMLWSLGAADANGTWFDLYVNYVTPFAGGTTTSRPTSADERAVWNNIYGGADASNIDYRVNVIRSTDGKGWRILGVRADNSCCNTYIQWEQARSFIGASWGQSIITGMVANQTSSVQTWDVFTGGAYHVGYDNGAWRLMGLAVPYLAAGALPNSLAFGANPVAAAWPMVANIFADTVNGAMGMYDDMWFGVCNSGVANNGSSMYSFPAAGTLHQFAQFGGIIVPWCKTAPAPTLGVLDAYEVAAPAGAAGGAVSQSVSGLAPG